MKHLITIDGMKFEGWVDYDRKDGKLDKLSFNGKVDYLEYRVNKILIEPLNKIIEPDIKNVLDNEEISIMLGFTVLICNGIEAFGIFCADKKGSWETFKNFVEDYMDKKWSEIRPGKDGKAYSYYLRENYRNGLAHGFTVKGGGIEGHDPNLEYIRETENGLQINQYKLFDDFKDAVKKYYNDLKESGEKSEKGINFLKRFNSVFIRGE